LFLLNKFNGVYVNTRKCLRKEFEFDLEKMKKKEEEKTADSEKPKVKGIIEETVERFALIS
jgi:hypothetical protein